MRRRSVLILAMSSSQNLTQVYSIDEWEDVLGHQRYQKHADQQSDDRHNRKINAGQTMYDIVNFYLLFQLFVQSFQQVDKKSNFESERFGITSSTVDYICR